MCANMLETKIIRSYDERGLVSEERWYDDGKLTVDDPQVRENLIKAMKDYTDTYIKGCTPPSSTTWKDPDNNVAFHNKTIVMTHNFTSSAAEGFSTESAGNIR